MPDNLLEVALNDKTEGKFRGSELAILTRKNSFLSIYFHLNALFELITKIFKNTLHFRVSLSKSTPSNGMPGRETSDLMKVSKIY